MSAETPVPPATPADLDPAVERLRSTAADPDHLRGLRAGLSRAAEAEGPVDVRLRRLDSPLGSLLLAGTDAGLAYVAFESESEDAVQELLAARLGPRVLWSARGLDPAAVALEDYLAGRTRGVDVALDTRLATGFRGDVQRALGSIDYGSTATYKELAATLGRPAAVRAVGTACATNPLPLVWPCHRVLRSDGGLGGYRGGLESKSWLLELEARNAG